MKKPKRRRSFNQFSSSLGSRPFDLKLLSWLLGQVGSWVIFLTVVVLLVSLNRGMNSWNLPSIRSSDTGMPVNQLYNTLPNLQQCQEGVLKQDEKQKVLNRINEIRTLHQLQPVTYSVNAELAAAKLALIRAANAEKETLINSSFQCWSTLAEQNASNNVGYSVHYSSNGTYRPAMNLIKSEGFLAGMLQDSRRGDLAARRLLLNPFLQFIAFARVDGDAPGRKVQIPDKSGKLQETIQDYISSASIAAVSISTKQASDNTPHLVAYPFEDYPKELFQNNEFRNGYPLMSVSVVADRVNASNNGSRQVDFAIAHVTIKDPNGKFVPINNLQFDHKGFGLENFLSWSADSIKPNVKYTVQISNVRLAGSYVNYDYWFRLK
jgi:hypothetical protein